ncbi:hypothetical protein [Spirulina sp. 06S082]|nr:hypothetical protein [Spirulina sp. 06S082]MEA5468147.1 hypothetical protein [Spirulina sp. 06S082]
MSEKFGYADLSLGKCDRLHLFILTIQQERDRATEWAALAQ